MLSDLEIQKIIIEVARKTLGPEEVESVSAGFTLDSDGEEAIALTLVVAKGALDRVSDDAVLDTLVGIRKRLDEENEQRLPIVSYATQEELDLVGDP